VLKALKELAERRGRRNTRNSGAEFGKVFKEGLSVDWKNKDAIAELCRFESMKTEPGKLTSLAQYVAAMPEEQKDIYYVTGLGRRAVESSPHLEAFKKKGYDVLFWSTPIDEWVVQALWSSTNASLKSITHGDIDLGRADKPAEEGRLRAVSPR
jgi:molecular chaperone HtpG